MVETVEFRHLEDIQAALDEHAVRLVSQYIAGGPGCIMFPQDLQSMLRQIDAKDARIQGLLKALQRAKEMVDKAHPQFNWSQSALDADAIKLLNEVPAEIEQAIKAK